MKSRVYISPSLTKSIQKLLCELKNCLHIFLPALSLAMLHFPNLTAQPGINELQTARIDSVLKERGEAYIAIPPDRKKTGLLLARHLSFDVLRNDTVYYYVSSRDTTILFSSGAGFIVLPAPSMRNTLKMASSIPEVLAGLAYPSYSQYLDIMKTFSENYPSMLTIDTIGYSINNKLILAARIHTNMPDNEKKPYVFLSSTMHGDEPPGYVVLLMLINRLMEEYGNSENIRNILDNLILIINPLANPDGTYFQSDNEVFGSKRFNLNNVDLNRNFPDPVMGEFPYGTPRQAENIAMINYMNTYRPALSMNLHSGAEVVNYPWDSKYDLHPDNNWFRFVSQEYADTAGAGFPQYMSRFPGGITNGAAWYIVYGGRQDYVTAFLQGRELTLEMSEEKIPPASGLLFLWERNYKSLINYIRQSQFGIHGTITDHENGKPLRARINLSGHDALNSYVYSDSLSGTFHRFVKAGSYRLIAEKQGYYSKLAELNIGDYERAELMLKLKKKEVSSDAGEITLYPNPFRNELRIDFFSETDGYAKAEVYSLTGQLVHSTRHEAIEGDNIIFLTDIPVGIYILKLITPEKEFVKRIICLPLN